MADAASKAAGWGKRGRPDTGFDASSRNPADAGRPPLAMRAAEFIDRSPAMETLSLELHAELFQWLDARARACVARCSAQLARRVRLVRRIEAGTLLEGGQTRAHALEGRHASDRWLYDRAAKVAQTRGWQNFSIDFRDFDAGELVALEALGFEAGHRFTHINGQRCHQPVLDGIAKASGWQSLSASYSRKQLQQGLNSIAGALVPGDPELRRELSLCVFDCEERIAIDVPAGLRAHGLDLVELYLDQVIDPADLLPCFKDEGKLQSLEILVEPSVIDVAQVIEVIGRNFRELCYFRLVGYRPFGFAPHAWSTFLSSHSKLESLDLNHVHFGLHEYPLDLSLLKVKALVLDDFHLADPGRKLEAWIRDSHQLEKLEIELVKSALLRGDPAEVQVRNRLLEAIAANTALTELSLKGNGWMLDGDGGEPCDSFLSLMESIISHPHLHALQIPAFDIRGLDDLLNGASQLFDSPLMEKLTALESLQPTLRLTLGELAMEPILFKTSISGSDQALLPSLRNWSKVNRMPDAGEALQFSVAMRIWGEGAFRRFIKFCLLEPDRQQRYLIGLAKRGDLEEDSLKIVRVGIRDD